MKSEIMMHVDGMLTIQCDGTPEECKWCAAGQIPLPLSDITGSSLRNKDWAKIILNRIEKEEQDYATLHGLDNVTLAPVEYSELLTGMLNGGIKNLHAPKEIVKMGGRALKIYLTAFEDDPE